MSVKKVQETTLDVAFELIPRATDGDNAPEKISAISIQEALDPKTYDWSKNYLTGFHFNQCVNAKVTTESGEVFDFKNSKQIGPQYVFAKKVIPLEDFNTAAEYATLRNQLKNTVMMDNFTEVGAVIYQTPGGNVTALPAYVSNTVLIDKSGNTLFSKLK
jgi:hypothetical protein